MISNSVIFKNDKKNYLSRKKNSQFTAHQTCDIKLISSNEPSMVNVLSGQFNFDL